MNRMNSTDHKGLLFCSISLWFLLFGWSGFYQCVVAQDTVDKSKKTYQAITAADPDILVDNLKILIRPLMKAELEIETQAWLKILQKHSQAIGETELTLKSREIKADTEVEAAEKKIEKKIEVAETKAETTDAPVTVDTDIAPTKSQVAADYLETKLIDLRTEETLLVERVRAVLDELKAKGGDITEYNTYIDAVTGIRNIATTTSVVAVVTGWFRAPEGGLYWGNLILRALAIFFVFWILSKFAGRGLERAISSRMVTSNLLKNFVRKMTGWVVLAIGGVMALGALGVEIGPLMAAMGAGGFIVGFALQETLSNFASGLMIMIYRPFDLEDFISIGGESGTVKTLSLVTTTLLTVDNKVVIIPNKTAWGDTIINFTREKTRRVDLVMGISYSDDIQKAIDVLIKIASQHDLVLKEPAPVVKVSELADSSVNLLFLPWSNTPDYWTVYWDLTWRAKEEFDAAGISIPFPQRDIHIQEGSTDSD